MKEYVVPYGLILKFKDLIKKEELEKLITIPLLKLNNKAEVILWPFNNLESYKIENIELKSTILIIPRVRNV